jgi:hypothetical protein
LLDRGFDFFDGAHGRQYTCLGNHRQRFFFGLTPVISGSRPWANHTAGCYLESAASRGLATPCACCWRVDHLVGTCSGKSFSYRFSNSSILAGTR